MDSQRFDQLTKSLGTHGSRRRLLKGVFSFGGLAIFGRAIRIESTSAARRPSDPSPRITCPGIQLLIDGMCQCPNGLSNCGPDCCNPDASGADHSECCDNACCYGTCYGEELCCSYPRAWCDSTGECCAEGSFCCGDAGCLGNGHCCRNEQCTDWPNSACDLESQRCVCTPNTCSSSQCGERTDGCGGIIDCGSCTEWPNSYCDPVLSECACAPTSCQEGQCGDVPDGCGISLYCGECTTYENSYCNAETHQCACAPWICEEQFPGYCADNVPDGCGGLMRCTCPPGFNCSGAHCVDDPITCHAGENWCDDHLMGCSGGNCACLPGMDGNTYCSWFLGGYNSCDFCQTNDDCKQLLNIDRAVCLAVSRTTDGRSCIPCTTHGACAISCLF